MTYKIIEFENNNPYSKDFKYGKIDSILPHLIVLHKRRNRLELKGNDRPRIIITYDRYLKSLEAGKCLTMDEYDAIVEQKELIVEKCDEDVNFYDIAAGVLLSLLSIVIVYLFAPPLP